MSPSCRKALTTGGNDAQNIAVRFDGSDGHCLCRLHLWDDSRIQSFTATVGHNQSGQPTIALGASEHRQAARAVAEARIMKMPDFPEPPLDGAFQEERPGD